jgi:hypothetical protein
MTTTMIGTRNMKAMSEKTTKHDEEDEAEKDKMNMEKRDRARGGQGGYR